MKPTDLLKSATQKSAQAITPIPGDGVGPSGGGAPALPPAPALPMAGKPSPSVMEAGAAQGEAQARAEIAAERAHAAKGAELAQAPAPAGAWKPGEDIASISGQIPAFPPKPGGSDAPAPEPMPHGDWKPGDDLASISGGLPTFPPKPPKPTPEQLAAGGTGGEVPNSPSFGVKPPDEGIMASVQKWVSDPANQKYLLGGAGLTAAGALAYLLTRDREEPAPKKRRRAAVA